MTLPTLDGSLPPAYSVGSADATINVGGVPNGSWMVLAIVGGHTGLTFPTPAGWTVLVAPFNMNTRKVAVFAKIKDPGDGVVSFPKGGVTTGTSIGVVYGSGGDPPTDWIIGTGKLRITPPSETNTTTALSITTTESDVLALSISAEATTAEDSPNPPVTPPSTSGSGWNNFLYVPDLPAPDTTNIEQIRIGYKPMPIPGSTGNVVDTYPNVQNMNGWAIQIGITPSVTSPPTSFAVKVWDGGAEVDGHIWVYDGSEEKPVQDVLALPHQGYTISQMEADITNGDMVYWAHRGGSLNFSEMTMRAYTNAIWHGAKVLEYSARRTADGVWIGMHDVTLDRVTALTGNVSSYNWGDLEGVPVDTPVADGGTISRIEDLIAAYPDFVLIFDDKSNTFQSEFLTLLKTVPDWQEHVIVKFDGQYAASMGAAAKAEGFKTCAYFYDDAVDTYLAPIATYIDYIGLNYDADPANWTTALSYGKPVWGPPLPLPRPLARARRSFSVPTC
jgi:hypothetical protein